tara:strand:+ start:654 stop:1103 length:450 start_codon:yes stop_codon:yes gene_type:complete
MIEKNVFEFKTDIDFNFLSKILDENNYTSVFGANWHESFILNGTFLIRNVENNNNFSFLKEHLDLRFKKQDETSNLHMFFSFKSGATSITHEDNEDVYIIGAMGRTLYKINNEEVVVEKGDLMKIPSNTLHTAIGLTPRVILSYGTYHA